MIILLASITERYMSVLVDMNHWKKDHLIQIVSDLTT